MVASNADSLPPRRRSARGGRWSWEYDRDMGKGVRRVMGTIGRFGSFTLVLLSIACAQGNGGSMLEARSGFVRDAGSGEPVSSADVFQVYWEKGRVGEPPRANALRFRAANDAGGFAFPPARHDERGGSPRAGDALEYGFYHPAYGLVRSGAPRVEVGSELELEARPLDEAGRRASRLQLCGSRPSDAVHAGVAERHCRRPDRNR